MPTVKDVIRDMNGDEVRCGDIVDVYAITWVFPHGVRKGTPTYTLMGTFRIAGLERNRDGNCARFDEPCFPDGVSVAHYREISKTSPLKPLGLVAAEIPPRERRL